MTHSENATALIKQFEGCKLTAYQDGNGIWTVGYGHTGPDIIRGVIWTQDQADSELDEDLGHVDVAISSCISAPLNQNQFDALVSLIYNIGTGHFESSTVYRRLQLNPPDYSGACDAIAMWDKVAGEVSPGLVRRRQAEQALFAKAVDA